MTDGIEKKILNLLKKEPMGLTIVQIGKRLDLNRITVTKYLNRLIGRGVIIERTIGNSKVNYHKNHWKGPLPNQVKVETEEEKETWKEI